MKHKLILSCAVGLSVAMLATSFYPQFLPTTNEAVQESNTDSETENLAEKLSESSTESESLKEVSIETESVLAQETTIEETALPEMESSQMEVEGDQEKAQKEYKYAETSVNIRSGPGKDYNVIDTVEPGTKFICLGEKNGWTVVSYRQETGYVSSAYLSKKLVEETEKSEKEAEREIKETEPQTREETKSVSEEMSERPGMMGRISIPSVDLSVAVFTAKADQSAQSVVNAKDSAAYIALGDQAFIVDNYQNFKSMLNVVIGDSTLVFDTGNSKKSYVCTESGYGTNTTTDILDQDGISVTERNEGGLCLYTSKDSVNSIFYTLWQPN